MTDEEALKTYDLMKEIYGDNLPDPETSPRAFAYYVKLYRYYHVEQHSENSNSDI
jgi:hypothetical protein